jgi:hypothetical protein
MQNFQLSTLAHASLGYSALLYTHDAILHMQPIVNASAYVSFHHHIMRRKVASCSSKQFYHKLIIGGMLELKIRVSNQTSDDKFAVLFLISLNTIYQM